MNKIFFMILVLVFGSQAFSASYAERAEQMCRTEIMYSANPPKLADCVKQKLDNPDYKAVMTHDTFSHIEK